MRRKGIVLAIFTVFALLVLTGCAGANPDVGIPSTSGDIAGFWAGVWHGMIFPITLLVSFFNNNIGVYEVHNNGNWYNFGYSCGLAWTLGSGGSTTYVIHRRRN